jgi:hypothetical protein
LIFRKSISQVSRRVCYLEDVEKHFQVFKMFFTGITVDQDVIHVCNDAAVIEITKNTIHHSRERGRGVAKAEGEDFKLKVTVAGPKGFLC